MKQSWPVAALGLSMLLALLVVSSERASRRADEIYDRVRQLDDWHDQLETRLRNLRRDLGRSDVLIRDVLLETSPDRVARIRAELHELRAASGKAVEDLLSLSRATGHEAVRVSRLAEKVDGYWDSFAPLVEPGPEAPGQAWRFLRREVAPRRAALSSLTAEIEALNHANAAAERADLVESQAALARALDLLLREGLALGLVVALVVTLRLRSAERRAAREAGAAREAERELRQLSQQLVLAHEQERKAISRELHDEVGQMLTALGLEIGRIGERRERGHGSARDKRRGSEREGARDERRESELGGSGPGERERRGREPRGSEPAARGRAGTRIPENPQLAVARALLDDILDTVRRLSLGLRPSMLDDLGLHPALEWLARDFTARCRLPVHVAVRGRVDGLPDPHRTCVYRVVQEALTNCARHARASRVAVRVSAGGGWVEARVVDDGVGLDERERTGRGIGLRGMEERARELGGRFEIHGAPGRGTTVAIALPLPTDHQTGGVENPVPNSIPGAAPVSRAAATGGAEDGAMAGGAEDLAPTRTSKAMAGGAEAGATAGGAEDLAPTRTSEAWAGSAEAGAMNERAETSATNGGAEAGAMAGDPEAGAMDESAETGATDGGAEAGPADGGANGGRVATGVSGGGVEAGVMGGGAEARETTDAGAAR